LVNWWLLNIVEAQTVRTGSVAVIAEPKQWWLEETYEKAASVAADANNIPV
jgi:hypothetical protein